MITATLQSEIETLFSNPQGADREHVRAVFAQLREALSRGAVRAAEPAAGDPAGWKVNAWVKQGILLGFRYGQNADVSAEHGR